MVISRKVLATPSTSAADTREHAAGVDVGWLDMAAEPTWPGEVMTARGTGTGERLEQPLASSEMPVSPARAAVAAAGRRQARDRMRIPFAGVPPWRLRSR